MDFIDVFMDKWNRFADAVRPAFRAIARFLRATLNVIVRIWNYILKFRKIFFAIPIGVAAVHLALNNMKELPAMVGLGLQSNGEFAIQVIREIAVLGPVAVTAFCLLLMFCSRRILTPWIVSAVSLLLPLLILLTNTFPA